MVNAQPLCVLSLVFITLLGNYRLVKYQGQQDGSVRVLATKPEGLTDQLLGPWDSCGGWKDRAESYTLLSSMGTLTCV